MIKKNISWVFIFLLQACSGDKYSTISDATSYSCALSAGGYEAILDEDEGSPLLTLREISIDSRPLRSPTLVHLTDLFHDQDELVFQPLEKNGKDIYQSWQLKAAMKNDSTTPINDVISKALGMKHLHISLVRIAFSKTSIQASTEEHHSHEEEHDHEHDHEEKEETSSSATNHIWFGLYQQHRGQKKPMWCMVSAPIELEMTSGKAKIKILRSQTQSVLFGEESKSQPHKH